jgi:hypothetical protein
MALPNIPDHEISADHSRTLDMVFEEHLNSAHPGWTQETLDALSAYWSSGQRNVGRILNQGRYVGERFNARDPHVHRHEWDRSHADAGMELWVCVRDHCHRTVLIPTDTRVMNEAGGLPQGTVERKLIVP